MKKYYMVLDTETCNDIDCPLVYDLGFAIVDIMGNVYQKVSLVIKDYFYNDLMQTAYYIEKLPKYLEEIENGTRQVVSLFEARLIVNQALEKYNVEYVVAHNARFDFMSLNTSQRYRTCSKYRYFLPRDIKIVDSLKLARLVLNDNEDYTRFCQDNNYITKRNTNRLTAEVIYRYLTNNIDFIEEHTGLADVLIEKDILTYCLQFVDIENGILYGKSAF